MQLKHLQHDIFEFLCSTDSKLLDKYGLKIHQRNTAIRTGLSQGSVSRIINREFESIDEKNIEKIAKYFGITKPQARGEVDLPEKFSEKSFRSEKNDVKEDNLTYNSEINEKHGVFNELVSFYDEVAAAKKLNDNTKYAINYIINPPDGKDKFVNSVVEMICTLRDERLIDDIDLIINKTKDG